MARMEGSEARFRIVIERPVPGVAYSLQKDDAPFDVQLSADGEPLAFAFPVRIAPGPRFLGDFVRREGKERRFVYIRIGTSAGQHGSPWTRRMKIDIHDIAPDLLDAALAGKTLERRICGTAADGSPACATIKDGAWRVA